MSCAPSPSVAEPPERNKLTDALAFPLEIDMQPYTQPLRADGSKLELAAADDQGEKWYDLYGVVVHTGGAFGGHYYAYIRDVSDVSGQGRAAGATGQGDWAATSRQAGQPEPSARTPDQTDDKPDDMMGLESAAEPPAAAKPEEQEDESAQEDGGASIHMGPYVYDPSVASAAGSKKWFCFNDSTVSPASLRELASTFGACGPPDRILC